MYSGKEINLSPLNEDSLFQNNSESLGKPNSSCVNDKKIYLKVENPNVIKMEEKDVSDSPKLSIERVNSPSRKQVSMFVALTVLTIYTQGVELSGNGSLSRENGEFRVMTHEEMCSSGWIFGQICVRPFQCFWVFKQLLLIFYFVICFLFFKKYF